jgi:hypothetical protein
LASRSMKRDGNTPLDQSSLSAIVPRQRPMPASP